MISSEAPLLFSKACEIFIRELTLRAWIHTEDSKRRTQQVSFPIANGHTYFGLLVRRVEPEQKEISSEKKNQMQKESSGPGLFFIQTCHLGKWKQGEWLEELDNCKRRNFALRSAYNACLPILNFVWSKTNNETEKKEQ